MKKALLNPWIVYLLFFLSGRAGAEGPGPAAGAFVPGGEAVLVLGAASGWDLMNRRSGIIEVSSLRPYPVLALSSAGDAGGTAFSPALDLALSFDEGAPELFRDQTGHYRVIPGPSLGAAESRWARSGAGAALFTGTASPGQAPLVLVPGPGAQFTPGQYVRDFSLEFWLFPQKMENGEQILAWISSEPLGRGEFVFQRIICTALKNRLQWVFQDFFSSPGGKDRLSVSLTGSSPLVPGTWSHHLIRFDADRGLLEYLVNGMAEAITHTTPSGREEGAVYTPLLGEDGSLTLGGRFMGLLDEFKIHSRLAAVSGLGKYPPEGGRVESRPLDLGEGNSGILRVEASGGRAAGSSREGRNEYRRNGDLRFPDEAALHFSIRAADSPYQWTGAEWRPFWPGRTLPEDIRGRYVQVAVEFYPSGSGESTPYLEELRIVYRRDDPPFPPSFLSAIPRDGAVELSWRASLEKDVEGYLVYYGSAPGEYFGGEALQGRSPLDAGNRTSLRVEGLKNGTLYYFAVAAYDRKAPYHPGEFSREVTARPLRAAE